MEPSGTSMTGFLGFLRSGSSRRTWQMRRADSSAIVIITKTIESIMRLMSIEKPYVMRAESCPTPMSWPWLETIAWDPKKMTKV